MLKTICATLMLALLAGHASAQGYPSRPLRLVVGFAAGGTTDVIARILAVKLAAELGQPVIVENKVGASGIVSAEYVANAPPDGYMLYLASSTILATNAASFAKLPYDPMTSFAPVSTVVIQPMMIAVNPAVKATTLHDLVRLAKEKPGVLNYAASASSITLGTEYFNSTAGIRMQGIPYKGDGPASLALLAGEIDVQLAPIVTLLPQVKAGKARALAVTSQKRAPVAPDIPSVAEQGYPGFEVISWICIVVRSGTPPDIIARLNRTLVKILEMDDVRDQFAKQSVEPASSTPERLDELIRVEVPRWQRVAREAGVKPE